VRLANQLAVVTGGTSGLGIAIAARFVREGAEVVIVGRDAARGQAAAARTGAGLVLADLSSDEACEQTIAQAVDQLGGLTVLVNNARSYAAGYPAATPAGGLAELAFDGPVTQVSWATMEEIVRVGAIAAARLSGYAMPHLIAAGGGSIVNVSSRAASRGTPGHAAYAASKAALESLALSITADFGRSGVRCNTVRPGYIVHETREPLTDAERREIEHSQVTRLVTADDVAAAVLFLASPEAEVVSGVALPVDGGSSMMRGRVLG
jgi:meso-butanediol dehydrogenase / (S,S)-butanediol dehydrogenase / diacetyl reductase